MLPSEALRIIVDAPWFVPNTVIRRDFQTPTFKEEIRRYSSQYSAHLNAHPNFQVVNLMAQPYIQHQAIAKTFDRRSAYEIVNVIVVFVVVVCKD
jgi:hypothetical protein